MRVISGIAKSLKLETIEGLETRPTTDRIKETLFNMLQTKIYDIYFLDLFSGSGAIGIEALSRGAKEVVFVENNKKALDCIKKNLKYTKLIDKATLMNNDVITAINILEKKKNIFDFIFMDPPYNKLLEKEVLFRLENSKIINNDTVIIVEADLNTTFDYIDDTKFEIYREKRYKTNKHIFIRLK